MGGHWCQKGFDQRKVSIKLKRVSIAKNKVSKTHITVNEAELSYESKNPKRGVQQSKVSSLKPKAVCKIEKKYFKPQTVYKPIKISETQKGV